jgi:putative ABC transport system permease protein
VVLAATAGVLLGATAALATFGDLSLERVTGQDGPPTPVVPWWSVGSVAVLVVVVLLLGGLETARLRRTSLAALLRGGDRR